MLTTSEILRAIDGMEPALQAAYLESVRETVTGVTYEEVARAIQSNDRDGLANLLAVLSVGLFLEAARQTFILGARMEVKALVFPWPGFDPSSGPPDDWLRGNAANIRQELTADREAAIAATVSGGILRGRTAPQIARDILGRQSPQTGRRQGGVIGLSGPDATALQNMATELADPRTVAAAGRRKLMDPAMLPLINEAAAAGRALTPSEIERVVGRYAERMLNHRATVTAQSRAHESFEAGRATMFQQMKETAGDRYDVKKEWFTMRDERVRNSHRPMHRQTVDVDQPFISGRGNRLNFPGDRSLGAGYDDTAGCRCHAKYSAKTAR